MSSEIKETIVVVDDEQSIIDFVQIYLEREGFICKGINNGLVAFNYIMQNKPILVVLDVMLPGMSGFDICRRLRASNNQVPVIMLTAKDDDIDKILGLELGADDYLTKPFNPRELIARIKAVLRRNNLKKRTEEVIIKAGDITINLQRREVIVDGKPVFLRTQEFELLRVLSEEPGRVYSRDQLLYLAWGYDFAGQTRTVDVHIAQLRKKLETSSVQLETGL
jgi:DNA-binding response OmpR family regulator